MKNNKLKEAFDLWESFKKKILYENRFILKDEVLNYLEQMAKDNQKILSEGTIIYRARLFNEDTSFINYLDASGQRSESDKNMYFEHLIDTKKKTGFWGYNSDESFVPPENSNITDGRANPSFIKYLYTAEDPYTAMVEIRPYLNSKISIAGIKVIEEIKVVDFSYDSLRNLETIGEILMYLIMEDFSKPSDSNKSDYIPTQYVAEFIKNLGFDGIRFTSSLHKKGRNITIFKYKKCKVIGSKLYEINDIGFDAKAIVPNNEENLMHDKFRQFNKNEFKKFLSKLENKTND
ncbi:MAG: RES family NAD+ phosphorylase [Lysinibacillus fusiformis]|nr:RES family NAD+ phosphorylase [Lysinibacillus fusiformis]MCT6927411.1 RES family NAD+ phosphorylase [Lysinibacillus fusiformis]MCT6931747.1 RES family NAD+ phosphorylase [Lysinibacillus fusiformis]